MKKVTDDLVTQAVKLFAEPFDKLLNAVDAKCKFVSQAEVDAQTTTLSERHRREAFRSRRRLENGRQGPAPVGARRVAVDRARMKATGWAGSASPKTNWRTSSTWKTWRRM